MKPLWKNDTCEAWLLENGTLVVKRKTLINGEEAYMIHTLERTP